MVRTIYTTLLCGVAIAMAVPTLSVSKSVEDTSKTEFSQEQIDMYQSMVTIPETVAEEKQVKKEVPMDSGEIIAVVEDHRPVLDEIPWGEDLQHWAWEKCQEYRVSYSLFLAMCESESCFIWVGDIEDGSGISTGYMQIRQCNWNRYEDLDVHDPYDNIEFGVRMMSELLEKYQDADKVIMAYKGGETAMLGWVEQGIRLDSCDAIEDRAIYWEGLING